MYYANSSRYNYYKKIVSRTKKYSKVTMETQHLKKMHVSVRIPLCNEMNTISKPQDYQCI